MVWNWYHFVAIAILHQARPTDSADINTRLQLSDTSSIPPMHGGFLLIQQNLTILWNICLAILQVSVQVSPAYVQQNGVTLKIGVHRPAHANK